jgi:parallel beta-helix repeat protein
MTSDNPARAASFTPTDLPNAPMGTAKGIHPGRVFWVHDPNATNWDGLTGNWWDYSNTDQEVVDSMISETIRGLVSDTNDAAAWDDLFRHFNSNKGRGDVGYQAGEKIVIKINMNNRGLNNEIDASPHMVRGLLRQLVYQAGVAQSAITVYDAQRPIGSPVFNYCSPEFPDVGYNANIGWVSDAITYSAEVTSSSARRLPQCVLDAEYMINMAILKRHGSHAAVTLCTKNHFGTIGSPGDLHPYIECWDRGMEAYDPLVDIMGNANIGEKTVLYVIDGLYGGYSHGATPSKWNSEPFNGDWPSSIFASQDPVAIDSVGLDFLRAEWSLQENADNYLHEAAQADSPPSGTFYDSDADGTRMASLGVHEHWNNPMDKEYSRNLGTGNGIELLTRLLLTVDGPVDNLATGKKYDHIQDAIDDAADGDQIVASEGTYDENVNLKGKNLTVRSSDPNNPVVAAATVINGGAQGPVVTFSNGEDPSCTLAGFTITGGSKGIFCFDASPTIVNCTINKEGGVAMELWHNSDPATIDCTIIGDVIVRIIENLRTGERYDYIQDAIDDAINSDEIVVNRGTYQENIDFIGKNLTVRSTDPNDPAMVAVTVLDGAGQGPVVTFSNGESSECLLSGLTIIDGNSLEGGGIYCMMSSPTISRCVVRGNQADDYGGGMFSYLGAPMLANCAFVGNSAAYGGAVYAEESSPMLANCIFINNTADLDGGGMYYYYDCSPTLSNCTFTMNSATNGKALACDSFPFPFPNTLNAANCIFWDGGGEIWNADASTITITCSCVQDTDPDDASVYPGTGNIDDDPLFTEPNGLDDIAGTEDDDLRLSSGSPCIDAGDNTAVSEPNDLDGNPRIVDSDGDGNSVVDMGAYESPLAYVGDLNGDSDVDGDDYAIFAMAWKTSPGDPGWNPACDVSEPPDGIIDWRDVKALCENYLAGK